MNGLSIGKVIDLLDLPRAGVRFHKRRNRPELAFVAA
jgi:hypothetical protein